MKIFLQKDHASNVREFWLTRVGRWKVFFSLTSGFLVLWLCVGPQLSYHVIFPLKLQTFAKIPKTRFTWFYLSPTQVFESATTPVCFRFLGILFTDFPSVHWPSACAIIQTFTITDLFVMIGRLAADDGNQTSSNQGRAVFQLLVKIERLPNRGFNLV